MADSKGVIVYFRPAKNSLLDIKVGSNSRPGSVIAECVSTQKEIRRMKLTMTSMLIGGGLNVILDPIFIFPLGFGVRGAAIATVVSQAATPVFTYGLSLTKKGICVFPFVSLPLMAESMERCSKSECLFLFFSF
ncbi:MAG: polysaccharide biosynthesis C-terminal domain-containing protein [Dehalobacterium sp.]